MSRSLPELGVWYADRGADPAVPNRVGMLARARLYLEQFLMRYGERDEERKQVVQAMRGVERDLAGMGVGMKLARRMVKRLRGAGGGGGGAGAMAPDDERIQAAIDRGLAFLYSVQDAKAHWDGGQKKDSHVYGGYTALVAYAMMMADQDANDVPALRRAVDWVFARRLAGIYAVCFRAHMWETLPRDARQDSAMRQDIVILRDIGNKRGTFGYNLRDEARYDLSTTLAGTLTFWLAETNGLRIGHKPWLRVSRHLCNLQGSDGGWPYIPEQTDTPATGGMTAAALTILLMAMGQNHLDDHDALRDDTNRAIEQGMQWLDRHFVPERNPPAGSWPNYYLATVQHVGLLSGRSRFNGHDWYGSGAEHLINVQRPNGSWGNNDVAQTAFAVIFLARGGNVYDSHYDQPGTGSGGNGGPRPEDGMTPPITAAESHEKLRPGTVPTE